MISGDGGEVAVGASVKSDGSSPKKTSPFRGRWDTCGEKGHKWRDCPKRSACGEGGVWKEAFNDWEGDMTIQSPRRSPKQPLPRKDYMIPYMIGKLALNSTHFTRRFGKYVPGRDYFRAVPSQNGDKFATTPHPPPNH